MELKNTMQLKGCVKLNVKEVSTGKIIQSFEDHNIIVNGALLATVKLLGNVENPSPITQISFGSSNTPASHTDTTITDAYEKNLSGVNIGDDNASVTFDFVLGTSEDNGKTINEMGLLCTDGTLFARRVLPNPIAKTVNIALEGTWTITLQQGE